MRSTHLNSTPPHENLFSCYFHILDCIPLAASYAWNVGEDESLHLKGVEMGEGGREKEGERPMGGGR